LTIDEMVLAYTNHAESYYRGPDGKPTPELVNMRDALRPVLRLYGNTEAARFGPLALRAVRDNMVRSGLSRRVVNARIHRIRRAFRWAASHELIPGAVVVDLATVDALEAGRTEAPELPPVEPIPLESVEATLPHLPRAVAAMVRLQLLTGMRAGEVMAMCGCDLVPGDPVWEYRPSSHKTAWRGRSRVIPLGPKAVEIIREHLKPDTTAFLFAPADAMAETRERRRAARKSKPTPSEKKRRAQHKSVEKLAPCYDRRTYRQAVVRACDVAFPHMTEAELLAKVAAAPRGKRRAARAALNQWKTEHRAELHEWKKAHRWSPLQLRHTVGSVIRARYGLESAQVVLGHAKADVTQIYAERDLDKARAVMLEIG
jgi:integrase